MVPTSGSQCTNQIVGHKPKRVGVRGGTRGTALKTESYQLQQIPRLQRCTVRFARAVQWQYVVVARLLQFDRRPRVDHQLMRMGCTCSVLE